MNVRFLEEGCCGGTLPPDSFRIPDIGEIMTFYGGVPYRVVDIDKCTYVDIKEHGGSEEETDVTVFVKKIG